MRKYILWIVFIVISYIGVFIYRRVNALKRLQAIPDYPRNVRGNGGFIEWTQVFIVNNADPVNIKLDYANVDVIINGRFVGKCSMDKPQLVESSEVSRISNIELTVTTTLTQVLRSIAGSIYDLLNKYELRIQFSGVIGAYGFTAPIKDGVTVKPSEIFKIF
jgi:hypothetical protein